MSTISRHQCMIYGGSPATHLPALAAFISAKLNENHRCLYLNSPLMVAGIRSYLVAAGVDIESRLRSGALVLSSIQGHLINGRFEADRMIDHLAAAVEQSRMDGYSGLWASGDMSWEFGGDKDFMKLFEYECKLEEFFRTNPFLSGVCQYNIEALPSHAIQDALYTHESIFVNETLSRINPHYIPAGLYGQRRKAPTSALKQMLSDLQLETSFEI